MSEQAAGRPVEPERLYQPSFAAGEITPALWWRSDLAKWRSAVALAYNWIITPEGGAARRVGTEYVGLTLGGDTVPARLVPFQFSTEQQYVLEVTTGQIRIIANGGFEGGSTYIVFTPYDQAAVPDLQFVQSADVMTIVHPRYPQQDLKRLGAGNWTIAPVGIGTQTQAPTNVTATAMYDIAVTGSPAPTSHGYNYAVTASSAGTADESTLSAQAVCTNLDLGYNTTYGYRNVLTWNAVAGADYYSVYRYFQGVWAKVGDTTATTFTDTNFEPNTADGPPSATNPFLTAGYPGTVGYFQERKVYGGSTNNPETLWFSQSGNYQNFDVSTPVRDDDAITYTLAARQVNQVRHIVPIQDLIVMTGGGGWRVASGTGTGPVSPNSIDVAPQSFVGASTLAPLVIGNRILYVEARGASVREIAFQFVQNQYVSEDRSVFARHLLLGYTIVSWAYCEHPDKIVWAVRSDGALLSLTYLPEQDIYAWAHHDTQAGLYQSVAVISESVDGLPAIDIPYFVVKRSINGVNYQTIERMWTRRLGALDNDVTQAWYLDCALRYVGAAATHFAGMTQFPNGTQVQYLADGVPGFAVVNNGAIDIPTAAQQVTVGLAIVNELRSLPADSPQSMVDPWLGRLKQSYRARVAVHNSVMLFGAVDGRTAEPLIDPDTGAEPSGPVTQSLETRLAEGWARGGQLSITAPTPLPATVLGVAHEWIVGE